MFFQCPRRCHFDVAARSGGVFFRRGSPRADHLVVQFPTSLKWSPPARRVLVFSRSPCFHRRRAARGFGFSFRPSVPFSIFIVGVLRSIPFDISILSVNGGAAVVAIGQHITPSNTEHIIKGQTIPSYFARGIFSLFPSRTAARRARYEHFVEITEMLIRVFWRVLHPCRVRNRASWRNVVRRFSVEN